MITFKQFLFEHPGIGKHGQNTNDKSERTMINRIIELCLDNRGTDENYDIAYTFLESNWGGMLWDRYYELFHEKDPDFTGPQNKPKFTRFKTEARQLFAKWKNKAKFNGVEIREDIFAKGDEILAAVNTATTPRASSEKNINTNRRPLGRVTSQTKDPVYYAFSFVPSKETTNLLNSIKGKGPYELTDARRHKFLDDTAQHMADQLKAQRLVPDVITAPRSSSGLLKEFAELLAAALGVKDVHLAAYHKTTHALPADKAEAIEYVKTHFIDHAMLDAKYHGEEREQFENDIVKGLMTQLRRDGKLDAKKVFKPHAKFVKGYYDLGDLDETLDGKTVLVVDDVQSTGSTMNDVFRIARDLGATKVYGAVIFNRGTKPKD